MTFHGERQDIKKKKNLDTSLNSWSSIWYRWTILFQNFLTTNPTDMAEPTDFAVCGRSLLVLERRWLQNEERACKSKTNLKRVSEDSFTNTRNYNKQKHWTTLIGVNNLIKVYLKEKLFWMFLNYFSHKGIRILVHSWSKLTPQTRDKCLCFMCTVIIIVVFL